MVNKKCSFRGLFLHAHVSRKVDPLTSGSGAVPGRIGILPTPTIVAYILKIFLTFWTHYPLPQIGLDPVLRRSGDSPRPVVAASKTTFRPLTLFGSLTLVRYKINGEFVDTVLLAMLKHVYMWSFSEYFLMEGCNKINIVNNFYVHKPRTPHRHGVRDLPDISHCKNKD